MDYICLCNVNKAEPTLSLKPRGDVTINLTQGYQWPQNRTSERVREKRKEKKLTVEKRGWGGQDEGKEGEVDCLSKLLWTGPFPFLSW